MKLLIKEGDLKVFLKQFKDYSIKKLHPESKIPNYTLLSWFKQLFSGLKYIHQAVAHRDIKPAYVKFYALLN